MLTDRPENYTYDVAYSRQCVLLNDFFFKKRSKSAIHSNLH